MNLHAERSQSIINSRQEKEERAQTSTPVESAYYEGKIQLSYKSE